MLSRFAVKHPESGGRTNAEEEESEDDMENVDDGASSHDHQVC